MTHQQATNQAIQSYPTPPRPALDFADIRSRCPNAFAALIGWFCADRAFLDKPTVDSPLAETVSTPVRSWIDVRSGLSVGDMRYDYTLRMRDLFDFFDQRGVWVSVLQKIFSDGEGCFHYSISEGSSLAISNYHPTRTAAESAAFMAAFGKLEEMLKQEQG